MSRWTPNSTVATLVFDGERFLLVEELDQMARPGTPVLNQPAGHLELDEDLMTAAERETLEETGWQVKVEAYLGLYINIAPNGITYHRHCFIASPVAEVPNAPLDEGILGPRWMTFAEILAAEAADRLRSPMVRPCCEDFLAGKRYPLELIRDFR
ncbi:NUDIX hydrolase [Marinospirillum alkaliphilum]|uniref:Phosphatase NudJ n=1 Tax=Marinospirillum alkaliphilum DSM 21637 TaxID=1122209 RepID=A0A1K1TUU3_9GAMM|nr:NUDIX hydrolase [Marinospirillum alkaliphilum]SFX03843.1 ADP-ribose pyrophosphatase YjhB, NUDIX family [Marinospirillum alkaliphilum DSM 21637]